MITAELLAPVKDAVLQAVPSILPVGAAVLGASLAVRFAVSTLKKFFLIKSTRKGAFFDKEENEKDNKKNHDLFLYRDFNFHDIETQDGKSGSPDPGRWFVLFSRRRGGCGFVAYIGYWTCCRLTSRSWWSRIGTI